MKAPTRTTRWVVAALIGILSAAVALTVGHLAAAIVAPAASPLLAVGSTFIDLTPEWLKSFAIATFGESDKIALLAGIGVTVLILAAGVGMLSERHPRLAAGTIAVFGIVGAIAASLRPAATALSAVPSLVGAAVGVVALLALHRLHAEADPGADREPSPASRRRFLTGLAGFGTLALVSGGLGITLAGRRIDVAAGAGGVVPVPFEPAPPIPVGTDLGIPGVAPFMTPNEQFYRVDTALDIPAVPADTWRLRIHGMVDREVELSYAELIELPTIERDITLTCVSNQVGGKYVGTARWIGVPLATLLEMAGVQPGADQIVSSSVDGMTIGTPTAVVLDGRDAMVAIAMNGSPLPPVHGFPARMLVPGLYGYVSATKWLIDIELTTFAAYDAYWVQRGWKPEGPIKTMTRIDTPKPLARVAAGRVAVAGVAWAQQRGIDGVEVRVDGGEWAPARLAAVDSIDTWRQWVYDWDAVAGNHTLEVRATDAAGTIQTGDRNEPFPDGATGWHSVVVTVE